MRYRIVHMEQVEIIELSDFRHPRGERQVVGRIVEQGITGDFHFVIVDIRFCTPKPDGLRVGDKVNFVATLRQFEAKLRGDYTAPAVRGITGDSNLHVRDPALRLLL